jgi:hypothetical protein
VRWVSPVSGATLSQSRVQHSGGALTLRAPAFTQDVALSVRLERAAG